MGKQPVFMLVLICSLVGSVQATLILDQEQSLYDVENYRPSSGYKIGQQFTAGFTGTLKQIDMGFSGQIDGDGIVEVLSGPGYGGVLLQTVTVQIYSEANGEVNYNSFVVDVPIESGEQYTFYFEPNPLTMPDPFYFWNSWSNPYLGGEMVAIANGDYVGYGAGDLVFRTWVIPEPATVFLLGIGGFVLWRGRV